MPAIEAFVRYSEGLPDSHVLAIAQDANGFLWIGTQEGALTRFDGYRYTPVASKQALTFVTALAPAAGGRVWIATGEHGLHLYDPAVDSATPVLVPELEQDAALTALAVGSDDVLWIGTADGKVVRYDHAGHKSQKFTVSDSPVQDVFVGKDGKTWVATGDGLFTVGQDSAVTPNRVRLPSTSVSSVRVDQGGNLWIGTAEGLVRQAASGAVTTFTADENNPASLVNNKVTHILEDREHNIWIGTTGGLCRWRPGSDALTRYVPDETNAHSIPQPNVTAAFEDRDGGIWFGFFDYGMARFSAQRESLGLRRLPKSSTATFWEEPDRSYWVGTYPGSLVHVSADETTLDRTDVLKIQGEDQPISLDAAWSTAIRRRGNDLWYATNGQGLIKIDLAGGSAKRIPACGLQVLALAMTDRAIFAATWGQGLLRVDPTSINAERIEGINAEFLYTAIPDKGDANILWVGAAKGGLVRVDVEHGTAKASVPPGDHPGASDVVSVFQQPSGSLWIGTYGAGVFNYSPTSGSFTPLSRDPMLSGLSVLGVVEDKAGLVWFTTTNSGLYAVDPRTGNARQFLEADGVQHREFAQNSILLGSSGRLFVGGRGGYNSFVPSEIRQNTKPLRLALTDFRIMGEPAKLAAPVWQKPVIHLGPKDNLFSIEFSAFRFDTGATYAYEVPGLHAWVETAAGQVSYSRLNPGDYTFRVRAKSSGGEWGEPLELKLSVAPPFYRTRVAYAVYVALVIGILAGLAWYARQRLRDLSQKAQLQALQKDIDLTAAVQNGFLPETPHFADTAYVGFGTYRPAAHCSGDWWWIEQDGDQVIALVGDVTGHGPGPAMVTAAVCSAFRASRQLGVGLRERIDLLNNEVLKAARGQLQMTLTALHIDFRELTYKVYFAGGLPLVVLMQNVPAKQIIAPSTPLGNVEFSCVDAEGTWEPGSQFVLMTDGIPEVQVSSGRLLGVRKICQLLDANVALAPEPLVGVIVDHALKYVQTEQEDDWTLVAIAHRP